MKHTFKLSLLCFLILLAGCGNNTESSSTENQKLEAYLEISLARATTQKMNLLGENASLPLNNNLLFDSVDGTLKIPTGGDDSISNPLAALNYADGFSTTMPSGGITHGTVTDMVADTDLVIGQIITTGGYHSLGDGGGNTYEVVAAATGTADGGSFIDLTGSSLQARGLFGDGISSTQFGVTGSGDESSKIQAAITFAASRGIGFVDLQAVEHTASGLTGTDQVKFRGNGATFSDLTYRVLGQSAERFNLPPEFSALPFTNYTVDAVGNASVDVDVEQLWIDDEVQGIVVYHVDWENGSDSNTGSTNAPFKTIKHAASRSDVGVILLKDGVHYDGLDSFAPTRDIEIRSFSGNEVIIRMGEDPADYTFSVTDGTAFTYETVISRHIRDVFDNTLPDGQGGYRALTLQTSIDTVNANPGSWWYDTGTNILYIRMFTNRAPDTDLVMLTTSQNIIEGDRAIFLKNVKIEGGEHGFQLNATASGANVPRLYMKDCRIFYSSNFGIDSNGGKSFLQNVEVAESGLDNLNYHDLDGTPAIALEYNVISRGAGRGEVNESNNASSMHGTGTVARINGEYYDSYGPNIPDTDDSNSLNVGSIVRDSQAPTADRNVNFLNGHGTTGAVMYCHRCQSKGSVTDYMARGSEIFVAECSDNGVFVAETANSRVKQYWPESII